jgi:DNA-binding response OmpR family regulator
MAGERLLIIDDEEDICTLIRSYLDQEGYITVAAFDAKTALEKLRETDFDLIIMDIMLPDVNGIDLCLECRKITQSPILFLSCRDDEIHKIMALSAGGDDFVSKPFNPGELVARVGAHLRRNRLIERRNVENRCYRFHDFMIDIDAHQVLIGETEITLTPREFDILAILVENPKRVFSPEQLFEMVWKSPGVYSDRQTIMVYISNLRKKLEPAHDSPRYIINVRGVGYKFNSSLMQGT